MPEVLLEEKNFKRDAEFNKVMHRSSAKEARGLFALTKKNKEATAAATERFFEQFKKSSGAEETEKDKSIRDSHAVTMTKAYYDLATDFYEYGWSSSFHFCRFYPGESFVQALARHEHFLALQMGLREDMNVLDVGCGIGGPAREICRFTGANIVGLNNNDYQIDRATNYAAKAGLSHKLKFVKGDFMQMDFSPNTFDAVYAIEATVHAPSLERVYGEIYKVLKPGGIFGLYEWVMTKKYDESNPKHQNIRRGIELGDGIARMVGMDVADKALEAVGFEVLQREDLAAKDDGIPWYYPIAGDLKYAKSIWDMLTILRMTKIGRMFTQNCVRALEFARIVPQGSTRVGHTLEIAADALLDGAREEIFTPMMLYICRKPLDKKK